MSIFNSSFPEVIQKELNARQDNLLSRSNINTQIQSTAWIRMTSGVDIDNDGNKLAKENVLSGIVGGNEDAYGKQLIGYTTRNRHGIRPLPGISSLDCASFTANGSLRKVTVKFTCWDIQQLNVMEKLYMRPGYLICVEWGWNKEQSSGKKIKFPNFGEKFLDSNGEFKDKSLMELYKIANDEVQSVNGNFDICIGKVQNYNWQAREDNGYNCEVTIVTYGEILDSWKLNNVDYSTNISKVGIPLGGEIKILDDEGISKYTEGKLCGILKDLDDYCTTKYTEENKKYGLDFGKSFSHLTTIGKNSYNVDLFSCNFTNEILNQKNELNNKSISNYITLGSFCNILNYFMLNENITKLSSYDNLGSYKCQANPFQLSCDPNICLIRPTGWIDGLALNEGSKELQQQIPGKLTPQNLQYLVNQILTLSNNYEIKYNAFLSLLDNELKNNNLENSLNNIQGYIENQINISNIENNSDGSFNLNFIGSNLGYHIKLVNNEQNINLFDLLELNKHGLITNNLALVTNLLRKQIGGSGTKLIFEWDKKYNNIIPLLSNIDPSNPNENEVINLLKLNIDRPLTTNTINALKPLELNQIQNVLKTRFNDMLDFFDEPDKNNYRKGNLSNIYLNLNFLYNLIKPKQLIDDKNNKNEITLTNYIKNILSQVQNSIGSLNQFEIYADPIDNIAKIIDKDLVESNFVEPFIFNTDDNKSLIKNYYIKSLIFPEQSTIVAISTQAKSGKLSYNNSGLIEYNKGIKNRFLDINSEYDKNNYNNSNIEKTDDNNPFYLGVSQLALYTSLMKFTGDNNKESNHSINLNSLNNSLRDLMSYWDSEHSDQSYKSMPIPLTIGIEFGGIAGIRIGNIFNIDGGAKDIIPESFGKNFNFLVRNISQVVDNNYWTIKIEGYPFKQQ